MNKTNRAKANKFVSAGLVLALPMLGAWKCDTSSPPPPPPPKKDKPAAPNPDPAPRRSGIGNVSLTFWLEQDRHRTVTSFNVGGGPQTYYCNDSCHWPATAKPGQLVTTTTDYYDLKQEGWLHIQVVQNNSGTILCEDNNDDTGRKGGVSCSGTVEV
jgi:hypothetical protein